MKYFTKRIWLNYFFYTFLTLLGNLCYLGMSYAFSFIIDSAIKSQGRNFLIWSIIACALLMFHLIFEYFGELILSSSIAIFNTVLRNIVAENNFKDQYELKIDSGKFLNLNSNKITLVEENYFKNVFEITKCTCAIIVTFALLSYLSWMAMITILILSILVTFIPLIMTKISQKYVEQANKETDKFLQIVKDSFNSYWTYWSLNVVKELIKQVNDSSKTVEQKNKKMRNVISLTSFLNQIVLFLGQVILIIVFSYFYLKGYLKSIGMITTLNTIGATYVFFGNNSIRALMKILTYKKVIKNDYQIMNHKKLEQKLLVPEVVNEIYYKQLSYKNYAQNKQIIKNFNLKINVGDKILIRGKSGVGKTTLLKLLFNPQECDRGELLINNITSNYYDLRNVIAFVNQEAIFSKGSIYNNLTFFDKTISKKNIKKYFSQLNLEDLLKRLPNGLDTEMKDNVINFSGGEKQRLAIIRALASDKKWFFLDEITSALDNVSGQKILELFLHDKNKTVVMVAHKLDNQFLKEFNQIIDLK